MVSADDERRKQQALEVPIRDVWTRLALGPINASGMAKADGLGRVEKTPSVQVGGDKNIATDYGTGEVYDTIRLVRHVKGCTFPEAIEYLVGPSFEHFREPKKTPSKNEPKRYIQKPGDIHYHYLDEHGTYCYTVVRRVGRDGNKWVRPWVHTGHGQWITPTDAQVKLNLLYRLPQVLDAVLLDDPVYIVEGEKCVEALVSIGLCATTNSGGANKWPHNCSEHFKDARVTILPDNDEPGRDHAALVGKALLGIASQVKILLLEGLEEKGDIYDWLQAGHTKEELLSLVENTSAVTTAEEVDTLLGVSAGEVSTNTLPAVEPPKEEEEDTEEEEGESEKKLSRKAARLRKAGADAEQIALVLEIENRKRCKPPIPSDDILTIAKKAARRPAGEPEFDPFDFAQEAIKEDYTADGVETLRCHKKEFYLWESPCYKKLEEAILRKKFWKRLKDKGEIPKKTKVTELLEASTAVGDVLVSGVEMPVWLGGSDMPNPRECLVLQNTILHLPTGKTYVPSPQLFSTIAAPYSYNSEAPPPKNWLKFLHSVWGNGAVQEALPFEEEELEEDYTTGLDYQAVQLLQEWFGYCLVPDTKQQKILLMYGPRRSGKGTISRILAALIGEANVCSPTFTSLSGTFGLEGLVNKTLAVISDAKLSGRTDSAIVTERLLRISGEDPVDVERKFLTSIPNHKLITRFLILTNELPRIYDTSNALASRYLILTTTKSYLGKEDLELEARCMAELPSILLWAIDGWRRLNERGHFELPESSKDLVGTLEDASSPITAFVRDWCEVGPLKSVLPKDLYKAWTLWSVENGREHVGSVQSFGKDIRTVSSGIKAVHREEGGQQWRQYEGIGLNWVALDAIAKAKSEAEEAKKRG